jgi:hypothetical protein
MTPIEVKNYFKTGYNFKALTGMSASTLGNWLVTGEIPITSQARIQLITNNELKAEPVEPLLKMTRDLQAELFELREYKRKTQEYLSELEQNGARMIK